MRPVAHRRRPPPPPAPGSGRGEGGVGLLSTSIAVGAFLLFLLFAVQITMRLYATSTVNAAGYDAARHVASRRVDHASPAAVRSATRQADARFRDLTGDLGDGATLTWSFVDDQVQLRVVARAPTILSGVGGADWGLIDRTFTVRLEERPS